MVRSLEYFDIFRNFLDSYTDGNKYITKEWFLDNEYYKEYGCVGFEFWSSRNLIKDFNCCYCYEDYFVNNGYEIIEIYDLMSSLIAGMVVKLANNKLYLVNSDVTELLGFDGSNIPTNHNMETFVHNEDNTLDITEIYGFTNGNTAFSLVGRKLLLRVNQAEESA